MVNEFKPLHFWCNGDKEWIEAKDRFNRTVRICPFVNGTQVRSLAAFLQTAFQNSNLVDETM